MYPLKNWREPLFPPSALIHLGNPSSSEASPLEGSLPRLPLSEVFVPSPNQEHTISTSTENRLCYSLCHYKSLANLAPSLDWVPWGCGWTLILLQPLRCLARCPCSSTYDFYITHSWCPIHIPSAYSSIPEGCSPHTCNSALGCFFWPYPSTHLASVLMFLGAALT